MAIKQQQAASDILASTVFVKKLRGGCPALRKFAEGGFAITKSAQRAGGAMPEQERIQAIRRFQEHEIDALIRVAERERQNRKDLATWRSATLPTINQSVHRVGEYFADRGSPFSFSSSVLAQAVGSAVFRVKTSGSHRLLAKLQFDLADGQVVAIATVAAPHLPSSVPVGDVTQEWVELAAERVLIAMLNAA